MIDTDKTLIVNLENLSYQLSVDTEILIILEEQ